MEPRKIRGKKTKKNAQLYAFWEGNKMVNATIFYFGIILLLKKGQITSEKKRKQKMIKKMRVWTHGKIKGKKSILRPKNVPAEIETSMEKNTNFQYWK